MASYRFRHLVPVAMPAGVPDPLTLSAEHNFNLGTDKLVFVPPTGFGHKNFSELLVISNHNAPMAQLQPVAGPHGFGGGVPAGPAAAYAAAPVHAAMPAHAAVPPRTVTPTREAVSALSVGSTRVAFPTGAAADSASASSASSASSAFSAAASASASSTPRHGYAANPGAATKQFATRVRKRSLDEQ